MVNVLFPFHHPEKRVPFLGQRLVGYQALSVTGSVPHSKAASFVAASASASLRSHACNLPLNPPFSLGHLQQHSWFLWSAFQLSLRSPEAVHPLFSDCSMLPSALMKRLQHLLVPCHLQARGYLFSLGFLTRDLSAARLSAWAVQMLAVCDKPSLKVSRAVLHTVSVIKAE